MVSTDRKMQIMPKNTGRKISQNLMPVCSCPDDQNQTDFTEWKERPDQKIN